LAKKKTKKGIKVEPVFHIFCEGEKTEPYYIKGYIERYHSGKRRLVVFEKTTKNTPVQLVDMAVAHKKSDGNKGDVYWVVFDREAVSKYSHNLHLKARKKADKNGIEIAFSNVCFEYWMLLHFSYTTAAYTSCDNLLKQSDFKKLLRARGIENYDKGFSSLFDVLSRNNSVEDAIKNAERSRVTALSSAVIGSTSPCYLNPYTDVHHLLIDIKRFIDGTGSIRAGGYLPLVFPAGTSSTSMPHPF